MTNGTRFAIFATASVCAGFVTASCVSQANTGAMVLREGVPQAGDPYFQQGMEALSAKVDVAPAERPARNLIVFVGDGMGVATVTAARIHAGQLAGEDGESYELAMDRFPHTALSRTYSHDFQVSDSAATATAMVAGVKTRSGVVNVTSQVERGDCAAAQSQETRTLFELAESAGLATGVVSTARLTHATPASVYAHSPSRDWENDRALGAAAEQGCKDIAAQLIDWPAGDGLEIALGGGRANFLAAGTADPEYDDLISARGDNRDLTAQWTQRSADHAYIWNADQFAQIDFSGPAKVLGLFEPSHMQYDADRGDDAAGEPSLEEMTRAAIQRLSQSDAGYVLMVEGGRIDHAHHAGNAARALTDVIAFDNAVAAALELTSQDDTLVVVTADHSHTMTIAGYAARGNPILGLSRLPGGAASTGFDGKPYTTLGYINGPGAVFGPGFDPSNGRPDLSDEDVQALDHRQQALVPSRSETHAGEDVMIYAWGPFDGLFAGTVEQNFIFHALAYASDMARRAPIAP